ncbi:vitamin B12-transporter protein BtuF [Stieleria bergensis]|uniref:Vitamin B12-transporter protein BtuF n=1 Tax=Stieleria bergensis TaxID=2528025 RepID=A0A517SUX0_9BACT|nr:vitamin B12-transporter protein BtuF [Planctomycetes bacterium SV_7m_r]
MRIVSLLPSATDIVCALGLEDKLVGVSHECAIPAGAGAPKVVTASTIPANLSSKQIDVAVGQQLQQSTALYTINEALLRKLKPTVILTQSLCQVCAVDQEQVQDLADSMEDSPVVVDLSPMSLNGLYHSIRQVAAVTASRGEGQKLLVQLQRRVHTIAERSETLRRRRVVFLEWLDPPFVAGHWNPELVRLAGGIDLLGTAGQPSTKTTWQQVQDVNPEMIVVACCGYSIQRSMTDIQQLSGNPHWEAMPCVKGGQVAILDGSQYFNRPGPSLIDSLELLAHLLHPEMHRFPASLGPANSLLTRLSMAS